jgi:hypothetical protein
MVNALSLQAVQGTNFLGWMDITADFEGSVDPFDCEGVIGSITDILGLFAGKGADGVDSVIDILGDISTTCSDIAGTLSVGKGSGVIT